MCCGIFCNCLLMMSVQLKASGSMGWNWHPVHSNGVCPGVVYSLPCRGTTGNPRAFCGCSRIEWARVKTKLCVRRRMCFRCDAFRCSDSHQLINDLRGSGFGAWGPARSGVLHPRFGACLFLWCLVQSVLK